MIKNSIKNSLHKSINSFSRVFISLLIVIFVIRLMETISLASRSLISDQVISIFFAGLLSDLAACSRFGLLLLLTALAIPVSRKAHIITIFIISGIYILLSYFTVQFFVKALVPLDHAIYSYSFEEIMITIKSSHVSIFNYLFILISLGLFYFQYFVLWKRRLFIVVLPVVLLGAFLLYTVSQSVINKQENVVKRHLLLNKADYFIFKTYHYLSNKPKKARTIENSEIQEFIQIRNKEGFYNTACHNVSLDKITKNIPEINEYPFLHLNTYNPLLPYFSNLDQKPNIVILVVESLDRRFFNGNKKCIIPFLDSLRKNSLYWENFYATSERTFGALPAILGSLPYGDKGFTQIYTIPPHHTLLSVLNRNDYYTAFYYGGYTAFQGMDRFLEKQNIDFTTDSISKAYVVENRDNGRFTWGYSDGEIFKQSIRIIDSVDQQPYCNVYLTLSTHGPFNIPNYEYYLNELRTLVSNLKDEEQRKLILKNAELYTSVLYADTSIKWLLEEYRKRKGYENTIFIITGDHGMHELSRNNQIDLYGVPLIIYSPLLNQSAVFTSENSHLDISPSLINLLHRKGLITSPKVFHWMSYGLDTSSHSNSKFIPFMKNNKEISECIYSDYFYSEGQLYKIISPKEMKKYNNPKIEEKINLILNNFQKVNLHATRGQYITPSKYLRINYSPEIIVANGTYTENVYYPEKKSFLQKKGEDKQLIKAPLNKTFKSVFIEIKFKTQNEFLLPSLNWSIKIINKKNKLVENVNIKGKPYIKNDNLEEKGKTYLLNFTIDNTNNILSRDNILVMEVVNNLDDIEIHNLFLKMIGFTEEFIH